jgi:BlaR1 peptidase M56
MAFFVLTPLVMLLSWDSPAGRATAVRGVDWSPLLPMIWAVAERLRRQGTPVVDPVVLTAVNSPMTAGWWRPVVMLPSSARSGLDREELEAVLAHELGHIARYDYFVNWPQMGMEVLYFYHSAAWWIQHCCGETVVRLSKDRPNSASALVKLAELHAFGAADGRSESLGQGEERSGQPFRASRRPYGERDAADGRGGGGAREAHGLRIRASRQRLAGEQSPVDHSTRGEGGV